MSMISRQKLIEEYYDKIVGGYDMGCRSEDCKEAELLGESCMECVMRRTGELIASQPPADSGPDTNVGEYIDTGCKVEIIHTVGEKKIPKHLKLIKDDEIVKEFILCKDPVGKVGYYETVAGVFYEIDMEGNSND